MVGYKSASCSVLPLLTVLTDSKCRCWSLVGSLGNLLLSTLKQSRKDGGKRGLYAQTEFIYILFMMNSQNAKSHTLLSQIIFLVLFTVSSKQHPKDPRLYELPIYLHNQTIQYNVNYIQNCCSEWRWNQSKPLQTRGHQ